MGRWQKHTEGGGARIARPSAASGSPPPLGARDQKNAGSPLAAFFCGSPSNWTAVKWTIEMRLTAISHVLVLPLHYASETLVYDVVYNQGTI